MGELVKGSAAYDIAVRLVKQNADLPGYRSFCGCDVNCEGVACSECPFNVAGKTTFQQLREDVSVAINPAVKDDGVRKPSHYQVFDGVESIEIIARSMTVSEFRGFCMGNVLKYRLRAGKKSELATMEKDLNKAAFYQELFDLHKGKCYAAE